MATRNNTNRNQPLDAAQLDRALETVSIRLRENDAEPTPDEIVAAAQWAMTHDVSEGFASILKDMLRSIGYAESADRL